MNLKQVASWIVRDFQHMIGKPAALNEVLCDMDLRHLNYLVESKSIALDSVMAWHRFGDAEFSTVLDSRAGRLLGWQYTGGRYESFLTYDDALAHIGLTHTASNWQCDLRDIHGFGASKSRLSDFLTLDEMVERGSPEMIADISLAALKQNLAWNEIRIIHEPGGCDFFVRHQWDGRLFLSNAGGSHHFAAAAYIARRLNYELILHGTLHEYRLNSLAVQALCHRYEIFCMPANPVCALAMTDALTAVNATYMTRLLPMPCRDNRALFLPRNNRSAMRAARLLHEKGAVSISKFLSTQANSSIRKEPRAE